MGPIFDSGFISGTGPRWTFIWNDPNVSAAFLTQLLFVAYYATVSSKKPVPCYAGVVVQIVLGFCLIKTGSRGALVAAAAGYATVLLIQTVLHRSGNEDNRRPLYLDAGVKKNLFRFGVAALVVGAALVLNGGRLVDSWNLEDRSISNRLAVWLAASKMTSASRGLAWDASNWRADFENWFLPIKISEHYVTPLNSYLDILLKYGAFAVLPAMAAFCAVIYAGFARPVRRGDTQEKPDSTMIAASVAVVLGFAIANMFSTLWCYWALWPVPIVCIALILREKGGALSSRPFQAALRSVIASIAFCGLILAIGTIASNGPEEVRIKKIGSGVSLSRLLSDSPTRISLGLWGGSDRFQPRIGRVIRRWTETSGPEFEFRVDVVEPTNLREFYSDTRTKAVFWGDAFELLQTLELPAQVVPTIYFPSSPMGRSVPSRICRLVLPRFDEDGANVAWENIARELGWEIAYSNARKGDFEAAWKGIAEDAP